MMTPEPQIPSRVTLTRRAALARLGAGGLGLALASRHLGAVAQEATPPAEEAGIELPPGVDFAQLTQLAPVELPAAPAALAVLRVTVEPGAEVPLHPHPALEIAIVEAGSGTIRTAEGPAAQVVRGGADGADAMPEVAGPGEELTVTAGDAAIFPAGNVSGARAGDEGVTFLAFGFGSVEAEGTPAA